MILVDLGTPFRELLGYFELNKVYLFMLVSRLLFLMSFGSESGFPASGNRAFGIRGIAKNQLSQKLGFSWFQHPF